MELIKLRLDGGGMSAVTRALLSSGVDDRITAGLYESVATRPGKGSVATTTASGSSECSITWPDKGS